MIRIQTISVLLFLILLSSCSLPTSIHPLSPPEKARHDKRLEGTWISLTEDRDVVYFNVEKTNGNLTKAEVIETKKDGKIDKMTYVIFSTIVDNINYLNIREEQTDDNSPPENGSYIFARYEFLGSDNLSIYFIDRDQCVNAIKSGSLIGKITYKRTAIPESSSKERLSEDRKAIYSVQITDTSEHILNFIKNSTPGVVFREEIKLKKQNITQNQ